METTEKISSRPRVSSYLEQFKARCRLTSIDFMKVWNHYDTDQNGKIEKKELDRFLLDLMKVQTEPVTKEDLREVKEALLALYDENKDGKLDLHEMANILPTEENFLLQFRLKTQMSSVDFMKVWRHYDQDKNGQIENHELEGFLKDLMEKQGNQPTAQEIKTYAEAMTEMFDSNNDGKLEIYDLLNILPIEHNFLLNFKGRSHLSKKEFGQIFAHYDTDSNGLIEGDELLALLQDLARRENQQASFSDLQLYQKCILDMCDLNGDGKVEIDELALLLSNNV